MAFMVFAKSFEFRNRICKIWKTFLDKKNYNWKSNLRWLLHKSKNCYIFTNASFLLLLHLINYSFPNHQLFNFHLSIGTGVPVQSKIIDQFLNGPFTFNSLCVNEAKHICLIILIRHLSICYLIMLCKIANAYKREGRCYINTGRNRYQKISGVHGKKEEGYKMNFGQFLGT